MQQKKAYVEQHEDNTELKQSEKETTILSQLDLFAEIILDIFIDSENEKESNINGAS